MIKKLSVLVLGIVFMSRLAAAQVTSGTISGVVSDVTGAVVPGASIVVRNVETGLSRTLSTDGEGRYRAPNLNVGQYEIQVSLTGFQTAVRSGITLVVGQQALVNFTLEVGQVTERVEVTGEAPLVEATRSDLSGVVAEEQIHDLPLNGRSYLQLAQLQPGMVGIRNSSSASTGGASLSLGSSGAQATSALYLLDGTDISDYINASSPGGASGMAIGVDMIREFRVLTSSFSAEYGRTTGAVISVVSKSGTNEPRGTAFVFHRNDNLDARNFFDGPKSPEFKRNQFGGTLGGPIIKDKTFFLGSYEGLREGLGLTSVSIVPNARARQGFLPRAGGGEENVGIAPGVKPFLNLMPLPTGQDYGNGTAEWRGTNTRLTNENFFSIRTDHVFSEKDTFFARYTFRNGRFFDPFGSSPLPGAETFGNTRPQYWTLQETHVFSPNLLNTFTAAFNRTNRANQVDPVPPDLSVSLFPNTGLGQIVIQGVARLGYRISRPNKQTMNVFQWQDTIDFTRGSHSIKAGTDIWRSQVNYWYPQSMNGDYAISSLRDFLRGSARQYQGLTPGSDPYRGWRLTGYGFFLQDEFKALSNLTLNLGLRYEIYSNPTEVNGKVSVLLDPLKDSQMTVAKSIFENNPSLKNFAPRFGFAWDPLKNGKLAVRGGFGVYFDRLHVNMYLGATSPPFSSVTAVAPAPFPNPFAKGATATPRKVSLNYILPVRDFSYPYAMQWNFSIQREIVPTTVVTAAYAGSRGVHIITQGDVNQNRSEIRDGRKFFPEPTQRLNPAFDGITYRPPTGNSVYHSLQLSLKRRLSQGLQLQAAYTLAKTIDEGTTFGSTSVLNAPTDLRDMFDRKLGRGLADIDARHNLVFNYSYQLPIGQSSYTRLLGGWQLGGIVSVASGIPFTPRLGFDRARSGQRVPSYGPDLVKEVKVEPRNVDQYYDLTAFQLQPAGFFGNMGRNVIVGPGIVNVDFSVIKNTPVNERVNVQTRLEMFNLFNRANFSTPADDGTGSTSVIFNDASGNPVRTAGKIVRTVTNSRQIQLGLKVIF